MNKNHDPFRKYRDELVSQFKVFHSNISMLKNGEVPVTDVHELYVDLNKTLQKEIDDLETKEFRIAFVGGFNSGKSTLINAIIGEYLLPEASKVLTSVPTHLKKNNSNVNEFFIHYLSREDVVHMKRLYREALAEELGDKSAVHLGDDGILVKYEEQITIAQRAGKMTTLNPKILRSFKAIIEHEKTIADKIKESQYVIKCNQEEAFKLIQDDIEGAFIDKVEIKLGKLDIPEDVVIVDLPGVGVSNPRHRKVTIDFITQNAHAVVLVLFAKKLLESDEESILKTYIGVNFSIHNKLFWVINQWDLLSETEKEDVDQDFENLLKDFNIKNTKKYKTSARDGLLAHLHLQATIQQDYTRVEKHLDDYNKHLKHKYNGSHEIAYNMSQIEAIRTSLFNYLNTEIKKATLTDKIEVVLNKSKRISAILYKTQSDHRHYLTEIIEQEKRDKQDVDFAHKRKRIFDKARETLDIILSKVVEQQGAIKATELQALWELIEGIYSNKLDLQGEFRKVMQKVGRKAPLYFEIETKVLTDINVLIKDRFSMAQREGISHIFDEYEILLDYFSNKFISDELKGLYVAELDREFKNIIITKNKEKVMDAVELSANALMSDLDKLMVWSDISEEELFTKNNIHKWEEILQNIEDDLGWFMSSEKRYKIAECLKQIRILLQYAYPPNPEPAQQLTKIAKIVPEGLNDANWEKKASLFSEFLQSVYKDHMTTVVEKLNEQAWLNVRDALAKTEADIENILSKYVIQKLELIVQKNIAQEFTEKREKREKIQELIGIHLKPFIEIDNRLGVIKKNIMNQQNDSPKFHY